MKVRWYKHSHEKLLSADARNHGWRLNPRGVPGSHATGMT